MSRSASVLRPLRSLSSTCSSCPAQRQSLSLSRARPFTSSTRALAAPNADPMGSALSKAVPSFQRLIPEKGAGLDDLDTFKNSLSTTHLEEEERHHLHVYATKHNTHITLTKPNRESLISVSCGNIGFRKAGRGSYDAGYQLAAFVMSRIQDKGLLAEIKKLEVVYRGFGPGREAVTKAILGSEGKRIRPLIVRLTDGTRLKFGGVRSPAPRRLG